MTPPPGSADFPDPEQDAAPADPRDEAHAGEENQDESEDGDELDDQEDGDEPDLQGAGSDDDQHEVSEAVAALLGDKLYFKIGEVARIVGVKPYVLRYWETEFSILKPGKTRSKHRLYRRRDVELLLRIKDLLHTRRFTIEGARKKLREESMGAEPQAAATGALAEIREALVRIRDSLG
ncbi:MAG TPA: MerR family transcriptional regulator [Candidatus Limnocylindrales bacterium]|nr:MerR family transcriptional regulator [Candidatus Limnocylindrales bacterium]